MKMNLAYIANACSGKLSPSSNLNREVVGFFTDSRTPSMDKMFLALRGERVDGNKFALELVQNGFCAMVDREECVPESGDCILVNDVRDALQILAQYYRSNELGAMRFVGITGSVGKTTTKDMVALALSSALDVHKTEGNANSQIGLPQTVLACNKDRDCAVVELGMSMPCEMERISRCAIPNISIVTNIGYSHIENLGSREAIRNEKLDICKWSEEDILLLNGEEPLLRDVDKIKKKTAYYISSNDSSCDCYAKSIVEDENGVSFIAVIFDKEYYVSLCVKGIHFVINSLFALATAHLFGIDVLHAAKALSTYQSDGKRQFIYESQGHTVIMDCYNASPESMLASLSVLQTYNGRRIAVLGDMLELGDLSESLHERVSTYVKDRADVLVTYGQYAKLYSLSSDIKEVYSFKKGDIEGLKAFLTSFVKPGDTILYKASNGMKLGEAIV